MWNDFTLLDFVGVVGSLIICAAYLAVSLKRVDPEGIPFQATNGSGAIL
ncbi:MAG: CBU_0592 family membrane protein, partial [Alphaproteobacteria bacterium]